MKKKTEQDRFANYSISHLIAKFSFAFFANYSFDCFLNYILFDFPKYSFSCVTNYSVSHF